MSQQGSDNIESDFDKEREKESAGLLLDGT